MKKNDRRAWLILAIFMLLATGAACSAALTSTTATPKPSAVLAPSSQASPTPDSPAVTASTPGVTAPVAGVTVAPAIAALNFTNPRTAVFAKNLANPDDLELGLDHTLYVSDIGRGTVEKVARDGSITVVAGGLSVPEGIVALQGGSLIIAEQGKNRLVKFDPISQALSTFLDLRNTTGQEGVDGLALDNSIPAQASIIIPDSPNGVLRRASLDGEKTAVIASGFGRPTGAWVEPDGSILVTDETTGYLYRVRKDGTKVQLARFSTPDDVIEDTAGNIYVTTLGDHAVHVFTLKGQDIVLLSNISDPQGITFTTDGDLLVTNPVDHQIIEILIHSHS